MADGPQSNPETLKDERIGRREAIKRIFFEVAGFLTLSFLQTDTIKAQPQKPSSVDNKPVDIPEGSPEMKRADALSKSVIFSDEDLPWDEDAKKNIIHSVFVMVYTLQNLGLDPETIDELLKIRLVRTNKNNSRFYGDHIDLGPRLPTVRHELCHALCMVSPRGISESFAQWGANEATQANGFNPEFFKGCGTNQDNSDEKEEDFDYDAAASAFEKTKGELEVKGKPPLFVAMANTYTDWLNNDPEKKRGDIMPEEVLFAGLEKVYNRDVKDLKAAFYHWTIMSCV